MFIYSHCDPNYRVMCPLYDHCTIIWSNLRTYLDCSRCILGHSKCVWVIERSYEFKNNYLVELLASLSTMTVYMGQYGTVLPTGQPRRVAAPSEIPQHDASPPRQPSHTTLPPRQARHGASEFGRPSHSILPHDDLQTPSLLRWLWHGVPLFLFYFYFHLNYIFLLFLFNIYLFCYLFPLCTPGRYIQL